MAEEFNIVRIGEKKELFGIGVLGVLKVHKNGRAKAVMASLVDKDVNIEMEFPNYPIARKYLHYLDGKNEQQLVRTKMADVEVVEEVVRKVVKKVPKKVPKKATKKVTKKAKKKADE